MARYIDADKIPYMQDEGGVLDDYAYRHDINEIPTANVVPKSEVIKLQNRINRLNKYNEERDIALHARLIANAKAEVAREIFEEISKASVEWGCYCITASKSGFLTDDVNRTLDELKKKYTE